MINLFLAALGGALTGASFFSPKLSFLVWFSIVPFLLALNKASLKKGIVYAFIFGVSFYTIGIFWLAHVIVVGLVALILYYSLFYAVFYLLSRKFLNYKFSLLTIPALWVIVEFLKEIVWPRCGWLNLGYSQFKNLYLIQIVDIFGVKSISFLIVLVNVFIFRFFLKKINRRKTITQGLAIVGIFILCFSYSWHQLRPREAKLKKPLNITVIQPNISQELKWDPQASFDIEVALDQLASNTDKDTLLIFPEAAWPHIVSDQENGSLKDFIVNLNRDALIGFVYREASDFYNVAALLDKNANLLGLYKKIELVPFGEYIPMRRYLRFIDVVNQVGDMSRGTEYTKFKYKHSNFGVLICFEDIFPLHVARMSQDNDFLINITNDAWFYGEPESSQHLAIMVFRAIENRIPIIRSANTGISALVTDKGRIDSFTKGKDQVFVSGTKEYNMDLKAHKSVYNLLGEFLPFICSLFLLAVFHINFKGSKKEE